MNKLYAEELAMNPCELCIKLNPEWGVYCNTLNASQGVYTKRFKLNLKNSYEKLKQPCGLCVLQNSDWKDCFEEVTKPYVIFRNTSIIDWSKINITK